ncbi:hypothetical protein BCR35DRAFT_201718 [Leucosporidium creatinivorum]|uniref:PQ loop repeat-domain-containing protein n=1 Tax=Leucosporidium creatinivorum TaxID=106004 RepID=A0A1Y2DIH1_9BASI|nr:hypothetical protein BCR35DRAFT_201718 [Leucosporidium creatinivorum]
MLAHLATAAYASLDALKHHHPDDGQHLIYDGFPRLSAAVGWVSICCWIIVYTPQLWLCVASQSGEGLSLVFLCIWLAGDATNLLGALWQGLLPTMIILAVYYSLCDIILIFQVFYYRRKRSLYPELYSPLLSSAALPTPPIHTATEHDPLLSSFSAHRPSDPEPSPKMKKYRDLAGYLGGAGVVVLVGALAWWAARDAPLGRKKEVWQTKAQVVGWVSAFLYLGSRLPQIQKNTETKCAGLSVLMFLFAMAGNVTYVASILLTSTAPQHLLINASWLVGSGGTILLDLIVISQFWYYSSARKAESKIFADDEAGRLEEEDA